MDLPDSLLQTVAHHRPPLIPPGGRVLVAVSGGPDSLSLLHALMGLRESLKIAWLGAAHLDHQFRGAESAAESRFVREFCHSREIPCECGGIDVTALRHDWNLSKQEAARKARYAFLEEAATHVKADVIATAHTRDDRTETVLLNILRGTGLDGLRGIPYHRDRYIRPLLDATRAQVEEYCARHGLDPQRDPSNLQTSAGARNRIRLELLPALEETYGPGVAKNLLALSAIAARDADFLHAEASSAMAAAELTRAPGRLELSRASLAGLHPALTPYVFRAAIAEIRGSLHGIGHEHLDRLCTECGAPDTDFDLTTPTPIMHIHISGDTVTFTLPAPPEARIDPAGAPLAVPGSALMPGIPIRIDAAYIVEGEPPDSDNAVLDAGRIDIDSLQVRLWRDGDRIDPLGMGGRTKKLQDIFTDQKIPAAERRRIPLVADKQGIVWVAGLVVAERARTTVETETRLRLSARRVG